MVQSTDFAVSFTSFDGILIIWYIVGIRNGLNFFADKDAVTYLTAELFNRDIGIHSNGSQRNTVL